MIAKGFIQRYKTEVLPFSRGSGELKLTVVRQFRGLKLKCKQLRFCWTEENY